MVDGLHHDYRRVDPGCLLRSGFESSQRQLILSLFLDSISCRRYTVKRHYYEPLEGLRPKKKIALFRAPRPTLNFCADPTTFLFQFDKKNYKRAISALHAAKKQIENPSITARVIVV